MVLTQTRADGDWEYWIFVVLVYGTVDVSGAWQSARRKQVPVWPLVRGQVLYWARLPE